MVQMNALSGQEYRDTERTALLPRWGGAAGRPGRLGLTSIRSTECNLDSWWEAAPQRRELSAMVCGDPGWGVGTRGGVWVRVAEQEVQEEGMQVYIELIHRTAQLR